MRQVMEETGDPGPRVDPAAEGPVPDSQPAPLVDLVRDWVEVQRELRGSRASVERVVSSSTEFAPRVVDACQDELHRWPTLTVEEVFTGPGVGFLQHRLTRALELGPLAEEHFDREGVTTLQDPEAVTSWLTRLSGAGQEGGVLGDGKTWRGAEADG